MHNPAAPAALFEGIFEKTVVMNFDAERRTSNAGITLLSVLDKKLGLTERLADCLVDRRSASRIKHTQAALFRQRVFSTALGCPDGNDAAHLGHDPALLTACGHRPDREIGLGSQPTLSRFENGVTGRELVNAMRALEDTVIERLAKRHSRVRRIFIDLDPTVDPTHGQQAFSFFNGHYDTWCYLPLMGFLTIDGHAEQHLFLARLRPGTVKEVRNTPGMLRRVVEKLRIRFKKAKICVRLDAGFANPQLFEVLDELKVEYVVAMGRNSVLARQSEEHMTAAESLTSDFGKTTTLYGEGEYRARSWKRDRRVIFKAEVVRSAGKSDRRNDRYVITNLSQSAKHVWQLYIQRGDSENRIKELKRDLDMDRTSSPRFLANQLRVLIAAAAFVLFQELRCSLAGTALHRAMVSTLRAPPSEDRRNGHENRAPNHDVDADESSMEGPLATRRRASHRFRLTASPRAANDWKADQDCASDVSALRKVRVCEVEFRTSEVSGAASRRDRRHSLAPARPRTRFECRLVHS